MRKVFSLMSALMALVIANTVLATPPNLQVNEADHHSANLGNSTTQSETSITIFGSTIVVGWNDTSQYATAGLGGLTSITGYGYSTDGGATFSDAGLLSPPPDRVNFGDPALAVDGAGNFYFASLAAVLSSAGIVGVDRIAVARSTSVSPTVTFATPAAIPQVVPGNEVDKDSIAVDTTAGPYGGRVYVAFSEGDFGANLAEISFARSTSTSPLAFAPPIALSALGALNHGAMPAVGPNGEVYVVWGNFQFTGDSLTAQSIHLVKSSDGGVSFANPDPADPAPSKTVASGIAPTTGNIGTGSTFIRTRGFPYIAIDHTPVGSPTRGNLYIVFQGDPDGAGPDRSDIFFTRSMDGGATWSTPRSINSGPAVPVNADTTTNDNWQPSISVSPASGHIAVTFYDKRSDPANTQDTLFRAVSTDGGLTWFNDAASNTAFTPVNSNDPLVTMIAPGYMGDYNSSAADGAAFHFTWTDLRNTCAPPAGAMNPCYPNGRADQDVFYAKAPDLSGPDLFIQPWGAVTGMPPLWQTPDIFVVDATDAQVNAAKGVVNLLRAQVRNLGNASATGVVVRFRYAPIFAGIADAAFKEIGTVTINLAAKGDALGGDLQVVPIDWDLTDLTDTNGGLWPMPISAFNHFCVRVSVEFTGDVNLANNAAQNNFSDVPAVTHISTLSFLVGNPYDHEVRAELVAHVPEGYKAELSEFDATKFGEPFPLKPGQLRAARVTFTPPPDLVNDPPLADVVAEIGLQIGGKSVSGLSARLFRSGSPIETFDADCDPVFKAIQSVLAQLNEPVVLADRERGLINAASATIDTKRLRGISAQPAAKKIGDAPGSYLLSFKIRCLEKRYTEVTVTALIAVRSEVESPLGGTPVQSNNRLELEHLEAIAKVLRGG